MSRLWQWNKEQTSWSACKIMNGWAVHTCCCGRVQRWFLGSWPQRWASNTSSTPWPARHVIKAIIVKGGCDIHNLAGTQEKDEEDIGIVVVGSWRSQRHEEVGWSESWRDEIKKFGVGALKQAVIQKFLVSIYHRCHHPTSSRHWLPHRAYNHNLILLPCPERGYDQHSKKSSKVVATTQWASWAWGATNTWSSTASSRSLKPSQSNPKKHARTTVD
jgi:hypothetical protein